MKRLLAIALIFISANCLAYTGAWVPANSTYFMLPAADGRVIFLFATLDPQTKNMLLGIHNDEHFYCKPGETTEAREIAPLSINGQMVKFFRACRDGVSYEIPETDSGQAFLRASAMSGKPIVIDGYFGKPVPFPSADFEPAQNSLLSARKAL